jgi:hypothetical protein
LFWTLPTATLRGMAAAGMEMLAAISVVLIGRTFFRNGG